MEVQWCEGYIVSLVADGGFHEIVYIYLYYD